MFPLTSLLQQDEQQTGQDLQDLCHDDGRRGEEAVARQRADVSDAEDERCILDHQHRQADVLQLPVRCGNQKETVCWE